MYLSLYSMVTYPPNQIPCFAMLSTPPPCAWDVLWLLMEAEVSQHPSIVMGTYTYWHVAGHKEKAFKKAFGLIYKFKHYKMERGNPHCLFHSDGLACN